MTNPEDFKTRLEIAKKKIKRQIENDTENRGSFMGSAFKLGTELVAAVAVPVLGSESVMTRLLCEDALIECTLSSLKVALFPYWDTKPFGFQ